MHVTNQNPECDALLRPSLSTVLGQGGRTNNPKEQGSEQSGITGPGHRWVSLGSQYPEANKILFNRSSHGSVLLINCSQFKCHLLRELIPTHPILNSSLTNKAILQHTALFRVFKVYLTLKLFLVLFFSC